MWVTVSKGLRVKVLLLELSDGVTVSNDLRVNLFNKVGYHGLSFFYQNHPVGYLELPSQR